MPPPIQPKTTCVGGDTAHASRKGKMQDSANRQSLTLWEYVRVGINPRKWFKDQTKAQPPRKEGGGRRGKVTAQIPQGGEGGTRGVGSPEARREKDVRKEGPMGSGW